VTGPFVAPSTGTATRCRSALRRNQSCAIAGGPFECKIERALRPATMENLLSSPARHETSASRALLRHVVLLAEMISDLHQHGDAFGIAGLGDGGGIGAHAKFPGGTVPDHRNRQPLRNVEMGLELRSWHRNQFRFASRRGQRIRASVTRDGASGRRKGPPASSPPGARAHSFPRRAQQRTPMDSGSAASA